MFFPEKIKVSSSDLVLEIGPGGSPFYRSNILFDRFYNSEEATKQSGGTGIKVNGKPLVVSSHERLPFKDKVFDYLICSHVLEHIPVDGFENFVNEMIRVSSRGYIEFPSIFYESFFDIPEHRNILFLRDNVLYVVDKKLFGSFGLKFSNLYKMMREILGNDKIFSRWILLNKRLFFIGAEFDTNLKIKYIQNTESIPDFIYPMNERRPILDLLNMTWYFILNKIPFKNISGLSKDIFLCPKCSGDMVIDANDLRCNICEYNANIY